MRIFISTAIACAASALHPVGFKFMQYLAKHGKNYGTIEEFNVRIEQFAKVDAFIEEWNANQDATSTVGHNFLSDWTDEEKKIFSGQSFTPATEETPFEQADENQSVPLQVDWVAAGKVGPVQDQGSNCFSTYAFAAVGAAASSQAILTNSTPVVLSAQQIISCSQPYGNFGCAGGVPLNAWSYMFGNASVANTTYPYKSGQSGFSGSCNQSALTPGLINTGSPQYFIVGRSNSAIQSAIATKPTTVGLDMNELVFQQYTGGVINTPLCNTTITGHALAVGYGNNTNGSYWIVQNSLGPSWGVQGYVFIAIDPAGYPGICGINKNVAYPFTQAAVNQKIIFEVDSVKPEIKQMIELGAISTPEHKVI